MNSLMEGIMKYVYIGVMLLCVGCLWLGVYITNMNAIKTRTELVHPLICNVTMYSSTERQTDTTPFITATGKDVKMGYVACNFLPIGTKLIIEGFDIQFEVQDRMNKKFKDRIDVWVPSERMATLWGIKKLKVWVMSKEIK